MTHPVADILDRAADLIEPEGRWVQGNLFRLAGGKEICWCAYGAILHTRSAHSEEAAELIERDLPKTSPGGLRPIAAWNDAPERTQAEVVAKLREAANLARAQSGEA